MAELFGQDLDGVAVGCLRRGDVNGRGRTTLGLTAGRRVLVAEHVDLASPLGQLVLAHELAHVVQHRRGETRRERCEHDDATIEWQADRAALRIVSGRPAGQLSPARGKKRAFDVQGHFYTVYLIALMAGVPPDKARELAFYAQLPDQILELDAIGIFDWCIAEANVVKQVFERAANRKRRLTKDYGGIVGQTMTDIGDYFSTIQRGLHCLNGGPSEPETQYRIDRLSRLDPEKQPVLFGVAIHSLGDSYAHRCLTSPDEMYPCVVGHAKDWDLIALNWRRMKVTYVGGHAADNIFRRRALYLEYGAELWSILKGKYKTRSSLRPPDVAPATWIRDVLSIPASVEDGAQQIRLLKLLITSALGQPPNAGSGTVQVTAQQLFERAALAGNAHSMSPYRPGGDACDFVAFRGRRDLGEYPFTTIDFGWVVDLAEGWKRAKR